MKIKSCTDADHNGIDPVQMSFHPQFLFWTTKTNENDRRFGLIDAPYDVFVFLRGHISEWGGK